MSTRWWSIEVRDGVLSALRWKDGYGEALLEAAVTHGARRWEWTTMSGGVMLELAFRDSQDWERFRALPVVTAALDATPDPINGLYVYPGRGGSSASVASRRKPRPTGAGAAAMPIPVEPAVRSMLASTEPPAERLTTTASTAATAGSRHETAKPQHEAAAPPREAVPQHEAAPTRRAAAAPRQEAAEPSRQATELHERVDQAA